MIDELIVAAGLVLVIEGLLYALAPGFLRRAMAAAQVMPDQTMRTCGVAAIALGVLVVWLARG